MAQDGVIFEQVEHARHLREDEHARALLLQAQKQLVEHHHLARVLDQVVAERVERLILSPLKEIWVVAALAQLHHEVEQPRLVLRERGARRLVQRVHVAHEDFLVLVLLHAREPRIHDELLLGRDGALDVGLDAAEQKGLEHLVQLRDHLLFDLLVADVEPLVELLVGREDIGQQEVEQCPQLMQVVLHGRASDEEARVRFKGAEHLRQLRLLVLHAVRLVDNQVAPRVLAEGALLLDDHLVARDAHVELAWLQLLGDEALALLAVAVEVAHLETGRPVSELTHPVGQRRFGC